MTRFALIIGIEDYSNSHLDSLSKSVVDANDFAQLLEKHGDYPKNQITLLIGQVNASELIQEFREFLQQKAKNQDAIIYFSGHGILEEKLDRLTEKVSQEGYLAASDCQLRKEDERYIVDNNALSLKSITELINQTELSNLVFILDACHSGSLIQEIDKSFNIFQNSTTYYFLAACQSYEDSWARQSKRHSEFTEALLNALSEDKADEEDGTITVGQAFEKAEKTLKNSRQKPTFLGKGSSYTLVTYTATSFFSSNRSKPSEIIDNKLERLKPYLKQIKPYVIAWAVMEGICAEALHQWFASDEDLGIESFLIIVREKFPQQPNGTLSLITVLQILAYHPKVEHSLQESLRQWLQTVNYPVSADVNLNLDCQFNAYLLVVMKEDLDEPFELTAHLKIDNKTPIPITIRPSQESPYQTYPENPAIIIGKVPKDADLQEKICPYLQNILKHVFNLYLQGSPKTYNLVIEVFLPFDYLAESVDLWSIKKIGRERKLGREYPVIIRSYERLSDADYGNRLQKIWNQMKAIDEQLLLERIKCLECEPNYCYSTLEAELMKQQSIGLSCVLPQAANQQEDFFFALHEAGVPLALWLRSLEIEDDSQEHFQQMFCPSCLKNHDKLIKKLFNKRQNAHSSSEPEKKWGYHAAMLLDNPERTPSLNILKFGK